MTAPATPGAAEAAAPLAHDVVVIGGGIAGLVAARDLAIAGLSVSLLEEEPDLGGRVRSVQLAGLPVELGAEAFATRGDAVEALLGELGLADLLQRPVGSPAWVITPTGAHELLPSGALGIPSHPFAARHTIGLPAALWAAIEPWRPRTRHAAEASLGDVARARLGAKATAALVAPVVEGVYSSSPDKLRLSTNPALADAYARTGSLVRAAREVRSSNVAAGGAVASLSCGLSVLVQTLTADLRGRGVEIITGSGVRSLAAVHDLLGDPTNDQLGAPAHDQIGDLARGPSWRVRHEGGELFARRVVCAVPPAAAAQLLRDEPAALAAVPQPQGPDTLVETVALVVDAPALDTSEPDAERPAWPRGTGALIRPGHPRIKAKALTHATAKWGWLREAAGPGRHVLRLSYGTRGGQPATAGLSDEAVAALALADACQVFGVQEHQLELVEYARAAWRIPAKAQPAGASAESPAQSTASTASADPAALAHGISFAGEAYAGTGIASVVPHARGAARDIIHSFHPSVTSPREVERT